MHVEMYETMRLYMIIDDRIVNEAVVFCGNLFDTYSQDITKLLHVHYIKKSTQLNEKCTDPSFYFLTVLGNPGQISNNHQNYVTLGTGVSVLFQK